MKLIERRIADVTLLELQGRLVFEDGDSDLRSRVNDLVDEGRLKIILDLKDITYIDSCCRSPHRQIRERAPKGRRCPAPDAVAALASCDGNQRSPQSVRDVHVRKRGDGELLRRDNPLTATNETERLAALQRYHILDTAPEHAFDDWRCWRPTSAARRWRSSRWSTPIANGLSRASEHPAETSGRFRSAPRHRTARPIIVPDTRAERGFATTRSSRAIRTSASTPARRSSRPTATRSARCVSSIRVPRTLTEGRSRRSTRCGDQAEAQLELRRHVSTSLTEALAERDKRTRQEQASSQRGAARVELQNVRALERD